MDKHIDTQECGLLMQNKFIITERFFVMVMKARLELNHTYVSQDPYRQKKSYMPNRNFGVNCRLYWNMPRASNEALDILYSC